MFDLYQHKRYPEYRLIMPHGSALPKGIIDEWVLAETAMSIEGGREQDIGALGYHLYRASNIDLERT
jgi:hypothetical protein